MDDLPTFTIALDASTCAVIGQAIGEHLAKSRLVTYDHGDLTASPSPWMDAKEAAAHLRISRDALYKRVNAGEIPAHQDGPAARLWFHREEVDRARRDNLR